MYHKSVIDNMMSLKIDISVLNRGIARIMSEQAEFDALVHVSVQAVCIRQGASWPIGLWCILVDECRYGRRDSYGLTVGDAYVIAFRDWCRERER